MFQVRQVPLVLILLLAVAHGLAYVFVVPIWQAPDEPMLYEYAALSAELGRVPRAEDHSTALELRLAASLSRQNFWRYTIGRVPVTPPRTMAEVLALYPMPRQVDGDPPLYFALAALPLRLTWGWSPERQVRLLRLLNALLLPGLVACAYGAAREACPDDGRRTTDDRPTTNEQRLPTTANHQRPTTNDRRPTRDGGGDRSGHGCAALHVLGARDTDCDSHFSLLTSHFSRDIPLAVAALVACQPMLAVIGASLSNDGLANLLGAALCWVILRLLRVGASLRSLALVAILLILGLLTKRTMLPYVPLLALLGVGWALRRPTPRDHSGQPTGDRRFATIQGSPRATDASLLLRAAHGRPTTEDRHVLGVRSRPLVARPSSVALVVAIVLIVWTSRQFDYQSAAVWTRFGVWTPPVRAWPSQPASGAALRLTGGELDLQPLPAVGGDVLRGRAVRYSARVWSDVAARGRLIVFDGVQRREWPFEVHGASVPEATLLIPPVGRGAWFGIAADSGWFYADEFQATGAGIPNNLLVNGGLDLPSLRPGSPLWPVARYLRLPDVAWALGSGHIVGALPYGGDWLKLFFASFWGHFGWMDVSFVLGSPWLPLLALICLAGALGTLRWLLWRWGHPRQRRQLWALLLLLSIAVALPVINAYAMPRGQALQQGRYLFPELVAFALVLVVGQSALLPAGWRRAWLRLWLCFWLAFALAALLRLLAFYA